MNPPDPKHNENLYHPDMNPNFYHLGRGFTAGTRVTGDTGGLENTIDSGFPDGPEERVYGRHPGSGYQAFLLEREALVPKAIESNRKPDGLVVSEKSASLAPPANEALVASVSNEFYWLATCRSPCFCAACGAGALLNPQRLSPWLRQTQ